MISQYPENGFSENHMIPKEKMSGHLDVYRKNTFWFENNFGYKVFILFISSQYLENIVYFILYGFI